MSPPVWLDHGQRVIDALVERVVETVTAVTTIASLALVGYAFGRWIGHDARLFDYVPIRWIIDLGHLVVLGKWILGIIKS